MIKNLGYKSEILFINIKLLLYEVVHGVFKSTGSRVRLPVFIFWILDFGKFIYVLVSHLYKGENNNTYCTVLMIK